MKTIRISPWRYKGRSQVKIQFDYDYKLVQLVRKVKDRKWCQLHKCWYTPYSPEKINEIKIIFLEEAILDTRQFEDPETLEINPISGHLHSQLSPEGQKNVMKFSQWLKQKRYSENTVETYISLIKAFLVYHRDREITSINRDDIIIFNHDFILKNDYSIAYQRQMISSLKQFFRLIETRELDIDELEYPRKERKLPAVFSKGEVRLIIDSIRNIKHKTAISILYGAGLRISELLNLRINDIDRNRRLIHIRNAKGHKDRFTNLSDRMIKMLENYYQAYKPDELLFEGQNGGKYSQNSCRNVLKRAMKSAGIKKDASLHTLRHSYATHLLENGTDIHIIKSLLGHKSIKTTEIYTHISNKKLQEIRSPLDDL